MYGNADKLGRLSGFVRGPNSPISVDHGHGIKRRETARVKLSCSAGFW